MEILKTLGLFIVTALAEIIGCYLTYLWAKEAQSAWLLLPAAASLAAFAWLLTLHPQAAGRVYAAYGGVYVSVALIWLWGRRFCSSHRFRLDRCWPVLDRYVHYNVCSTFDTTPTLTMKLLLRYHNTLYPAHHPAAGIAVSYGRNRNSF